jgi:hypothetical protein
MTATRRTTAVVLMTMLILAGSACRFGAPGLPLPGGGDGGATLDRACLAGTRALQGVDLSHQLASVLGNLTVHPDGQSTVTLDLTETTWSVDGNYHLSASAATPFGALFGTVDLNGRASGTYTVDGASLVFSLDSVDGTATFSGGIGDVTTTQTFNLSQFGDISALIAFRGSAAVTCNPAALTLGWNDHSLTF